MARLLHPPHPLSRSLEDSVRGDLHFTLFFFFFSFSSSCKQENSNKVYLSVSE